MPGAGLASGLTGCISAIFVNGVEYDVNGASRGRGVVECAAHPCDELNCLNGGTCAEVGASGAFVCVCPATFTGATCESTVMNACDVGMDSCSSASFCIFDWTTGRFRCQCPTSALTPLSGENCTQGLLIN